MDETSDANKITEWKILSQTFYNCKHFLRHFNLNHAILIHANIPNVYIEMHTLYMIHFNLEPIYTKKKHRSFPYSSYNVHLLEEIVNKKGVHITNHTKRYMWIANPKWTKDKIQHNKYILRKPANQKCDKDLVNKNSYISQITTNMKTTLNLQLS